MYDWKNPKHKVIGYQVTTTVSLKLKDFSKIGPITQQLADADVSDSQSLSYTLENIDEAKTKAVADAYRRAHASAQSLAAAANRALGNFPTLRWIPQKTFASTHPCNAKADPWWPWKRRFHPHKNSPTGSDGNRARECDVCAEVVDNEGRPV